MNVFEFFNVIIETAIILFYCGNIFDVKSDISKFRIDAFMSAIIILTTFTGILHIGTWFNIAVSYLTCFAISLYIYDGSLKTKLFISAIYVVMVIFADILGTTAISLLGISYSMVGGDSVLYITGAMLSDFIRLWLLAYVGKVLSGRIHNLPLSYWIFLFVCPVLSVMCLVIFDIYLMQAEIINKVLVFIPPLCILYINFMLFRFFENFSKLIKVKVLEELAQSEEENYKILQSNETELRKLRHDMKNHLMMLREYLTRNDTETALNHLTDIQETLEDISAIVYTNNPAIDAAINIGAKKAQSENIEYKAQIIGNATVNIEAADICRFLSNAIDNAIEACLQCKQRYVYIELNISDEKLKVHIENPTYHKPNTFNFLTTKSDKENHGYGMMNMKNVVDKYNGVMQTAVKDGIFYLDVIFDNVSN